MIVCSGFSDKANLDEGNLWPTAFAVKELTEEVATKIGVQAEARRGSGTGKADGEREVLEKIATLPQPDRALAAGRWPQKSTRRLSGG